MLFGHQNDDTHAADTPATPQPGVNPLAVDPETGASLPVETVQPTAEAGLPQPPPPPAFDPPPDDTAGTAPLVDPSASFSPDTTPMDTPAPAEPAPAFSMGPTPADEPEPAAAPPLSSSDGTDDPASDDAADEPVTTLADDNAAGAPATDELLSLKQQALAQLSPLVSQLDQTPEEKFRTTMMMIQSTDNQALITDAYTAAQQITDEKVRAQALLDVVNEINYFTQPKPQP